jgi:hypothetical protein
MLPLLDANVSRQLASEFYRSHSMAELSKFAFEFLEAAKGSVITCTYCHMGKSQAISW